MNASDLLMDFLQKKTIAGVTIGQSRDRVRECLGDRSYWDGYKTLDASVSEVWHIDICRSFLSMAKTGSSG